MEINNNLKQIDPYRTQLDRTAEKDAAKQAKVQGQEAQPSSGDRISLSPQAQLHTTAFKAASSAPELRQDMVSALKAKVESGEYSIDSKNIAARMLHEDSDQLLGE